MNRSIQIAAAAAALMLTAVAAHATPVNQVPVHRNGLDLSQPADAQKMLVRLERATLEACGSGRGDVQDIQDGVRRSDCYREALASAVAAFKAPALSVAYATAHPAKASSQFALAGR